VRRLELEVVCFLDATPRAERKIGQVCSKREYDSVFDRLENLPPGVEYLVIQLGDFLPSVVLQTGLNISTGIPILYPRLGLLEAVLSPKFFLAAAFKTNKFNGDAELLDDLVLIFLFSRLHSELISI